MKGPHDEQISAVSHAAELDSSTANQKTPGGKALIRLLRMLQARGHEELAAISVDRAVADESKELFLSRAARFTNSPTGVVPGIRPDTEAGVAEEESSAAISTQYLQAFHATGAPSGSGPQWQSLGPTTIPNGQTYSGARINVSGRVAAVAVDPFNPAHVLCGAANGGVWESFDRGGSWAPRTDYQATTTVGAIAFDPSQKSVVYCGTGEGNWWWWLGVGILRSNDGGTTWTTLCTNPFMGAGFYDLCVDPSNSNHLLAATTGGLYNSTNGGTTWTQRRSVSTYSVSIGTGEILAACSDGLWRSTDNGVTWANVALPGAPASYNRLAACIAHSNPSVAYAYGANGATAYIWRRAGGSWTAVATPAGLSTGQAWYDWYCLAPPDKDTEVFLGAIEAYRGDLAGTTWTWTTISNHSGTGIHPDQHALAFEPGTPNTIYAGCDGGLFKSLDRGNTWVSCNNGLVITEFETIAYNIGSTRWLIGGTQDNGTQRWTGSSAWDHSADGDGGYVGVNPTDPTTVFHTYYDMSPEVSHSSGDFGSWTYIPPTIPAGEAQPFYPPMRCTESSGTTVAIAGGALYVSRTDNAPWTRIAFPSSAVASGICLPDGDNVFVGVNDGRVFHTTWNGSAWTALTTLATPRAGASVSDVLVYPSNMSRIWVTYSTIGGGLVYRTDNGGTTWTNCTAGLPGLPVNAIEVDSRNANRVWVAMDRGVSQSLDAGATWADFSNGLPNSFVGDLSFHPSAWVLRCATRSRGVWEIPVDGWMTAPACGVQFTGTVAANQTQKWFTFNWPATWQVVWTVMPTTIATTAQIALTVQVQRASAQYVTYWLSVQNVTAAPVTFEGRFCVLSRY